MFDLINGLSAQLLKGGFTPEARKEYLSQVVDYSHYHFADEERLMSEAGLDPEYVSGHQLLDEVATLHMKTWRSSVSIGVACSLSGVETSGDLIRLADEGLYAAKDAGRSCIRTIQST